RCHDLRDLFVLLFFFFQAEDGIRDGHVTGVQTCALPISMASCCSGVGSAGGFARRSQLVRFTPAAPGPSNSRTTFPSLSSTAILTLPSFFSAASTLASLLGLCSAASVRSPLFLAGASGGTASLR